MKKDVPGEFLNEYEAKRSYLQEALDQITSLLTLRLGQRSARTGIRGRITDARVKRPGKLWRNAAKAGLSVSEAFTQIEDLIGIRIVCNNLSDIEPLVEMIRTECSTIAVSETKDLVSTPAQTGYRAIHVRAETRDLYAPSRAAIPCEIQIRTLAQDTWARISRADLYGKDVPATLGKLAMALSTQLSAIDEIGQLIRDELNQCPLVAEKIADSDHVTPQRLALLYKDIYREDLFEWSLIDWVRYLDEAEVDTVGEVRTLLGDAKIRGSLDKVSMRIRGFPLENSEWAGYSALVARAC
ncbi:MAG: RelA/SpoT domain-containing protein [Pseudomonadota bacterium]